MVARLRSLTDSDDHLERARLLAQRSLQYRSDLPVEGVADERLNEMLEVNNSKIRQIKNVLERTGVLGQDSERLIRTIEVYKERTYPRLRDSIVEDQTLFVAGYIKDLQGWTYPVSEGASSLSSRVAELLKLGRHADEDAVIAAVRDMSNQGHAQELLFSQSLPAPQGFEDLNALKVAYQTTSSAADEKAITLLSRKIEKGARGNEIIKDAQELLKEAEAVVNGEIRAS
ncbi:hypothetical protein CC1G_10804 [Coprinopsis cinerea okayama7|uniref:Uncharacterized protein n=1 Tax=Coprinopsis cinerea (strain Okayama-7 / 130 / ATCC MYA-4618 / FGSC 9003) TaxID=240176 RepID=A8NMJ6_COPC7|nr:hypothetical protein CC1G_10804 [Coprinopsis cinerea okayama7\|eukprot:XP_001834930.1 hypothetical protein CC1G_10804 [Coprinopsis cinerea okayama7\